MAKNALLGVLESTVGKYVLGLDANSLNVAVWSGKIELSNLQLNVPAINDELSRRAQAAPNLALPIRVVTGHFSTLRVEVPWARITSRPVVVKASGFEVVVEPYDHLQGVTDLNAKKRREARRDEIVREEEERQRRNALWKLTAVDFEDGGGDVAGAAASPSASAETQKAGFTANLVRRIIENLQIEIESFHVSLRGCGAAAGIVLGGLSVATTDENYNEKFVDRTQAANRNNANAAQFKFLHKMVKISGFGAYCDDQTNQRVATAATGHSYIISPMTFEAAVRQSDHEKHLEYPKYTVKSKIPVLSARLSRQQLELTDKITAALAPDEDVVRPLFPEYRPTSDIQGHAREWWKYAVRCIGRLNRRRSWAEYFIAYKKRKRYVSLYTRYSIQDTQHWIKPLSDPERRTMEAIEQDSSISTEGLMMWRNIADAQAERKLQSREEAFISEMLGGRAGQIDDSADSPPRGTGSGGRPSLRRVEHHSGSIYSSARMVLSESDTLGDYVGNASSAAITLTVEEMRELEQVMLERSDMTDLPSDSKLYDLSFELGRFTVDLIMNGHLASLEMGKASTGFKANADGSFDFGFTMQSLRVDDRVTPNTLFPSIVRSLQSSTPSSTAEGGHIVPVQEGETHAFELRLAKSKKGDQELRIHMVAFEIVASQDLIRGIRDFFVFEPSASVKTGTGDISSRVITKTDSGDMFYDASEDHRHMDQLLGGEHDHRNDNIVDLTAGAAASAAAAVSDALATSIVDAWNSKRESKKAWTIELDIHAPVLVLPESAVDPEARTIVADLGRIRIIFGSNASAPQKVLDWFDARAAGDEEPPSVDYGNFTLENFRCLLCKAGAKDWIVSPANAADALSQALVEPLTLTVCIGLESVADKGDDAGTCLIGILPSISIRASLPQIYDVLDVTNAWSAFFGTLADGEEDAQMPEVAANTPVDTEPALDLSQVTQQYLSRIQQESRVGEIEKVYVELALQRLSATVLTSRGDGIEAHLVSIVATSSILDDGSTSSRLAMGYFWIYDGLDVDFLREQRLVAHSKLPRSADSFAEDDDAYNIMGELARLGAFDEGYEGASDLAEVTVSTSPTTMTTAIEGVFSSLCINFNPLVIRQILMDVTSGDNGDGVLVEHDGLVDLGQTFSEDVLSQGFSYSRDDRDMQKKKPEAACSGDTKDQDGTLVISARMGGFEVVARSPSDDSPLLRVAATTAVISFKSTSKESVADVSLDNIIIEDERDLSLRPTFRYILNKGSVEFGEQDFFKVAYKQRGTSMDIDLKFGSPEIALPSDALIDCLEFYTALFPPVSEEEKIPSPSDQRVLSPSNSRVSATSATNAEADATPQDAINAHAPESAITVNVSTGPDCKIVLVDVGSKAKSRLADVVVLQGQLDLLIKMTGGVSPSSDYELTWQNVQAFTAHGHELQSPIQLLDPSDLSAVYRTSTKEDIDESEIKIWSLKSIHITVSMEDIALILSILSSFGDAFADAPDSTDGTGGSTLVDQNDAKVMPTAELSKRETDKIMRLSMALDTSLLTAEALEVIDEDEVASDTEAIVVSDRVNEIDKTSLVACEKKNAAIMRIRIAFPSSSLTIINDLQGLDDGLFKLFGTDFLVAGEIQYPSCNDRAATSSTPLRFDSSTIKPVFKFDLSSIAKSQYFDTHTSLWEPLLLQPWETSISALRAPGKHPGSNRLQTTINIDSDPCHISFSEQFLISLGAANRMWSSYSFATSEAAIVESSIVQAPRTKITPSSAGPTSSASNRMRERSGSLLVRKSTAANAARSFVTNLPYVVENRSGLPVTFDLKGSDEKHRCDHGSTTYFRFDPPKGDGIGGKRAYGQDVTKFKTLTLNIGQKSIKFQHLDAYLKLPPQTHDLGYGRHLFTTVVRKGRAIRLVLSSHISVYNCTTSLDFQIGLARKGETYDIGVAVRNCGGSRNFRARTSPSTTSKDVLEGIPALGIPVTCLENFDDSIPSIEVVETDSGEDLPSDDDDAARRKSDELKIIITPKVMGNTTTTDLPVQGHFILPPIADLLEKASGGSSLDTTEVLCSRESGEYNENHVGPTQPGSLVVRILFQITLVGGHPCMDIFLHPRLLIENTVPLKLNARFSSRYSFSSSSYVSEENDDNEVVHMLKPREMIESFSAGSSCTASIKIGEQPRSGTATGWSESFEVPLSRRIASPLKAVLPFVCKSEKGTVSPLYANKERGDHLYILEFSDLASFTAMDEQDGHSNKAGTDSDQAERPSVEVRRLSIVAMNIAIDHTGDVLLQEVEKDRKSTSKTKQEQSSTSLVASTYGSFDLPNRTRARLSLIPSPDSQFRLIRPKLDASGATLSSTFRVKDVIFCGGGVQSSAILYDNKMVSGLFAYRKFSSYGQSEIHIIPEFLIYNGTEADIEIIQQGRADLSLKKDSIAPLSMPDRAKGLILLIRFPFIGGRIDNIRLDGLGSRINVIRRDSDGTPIGSIRLQTEPGHSDSRIVIKVGPLKLSGGAAERIKEEEKAELLFSGDFFRFRATMAELQITLSDTQLSSIRGAVYEKNRAAIESAFDVHSPEAGDNANEESFIGITADEGAVAQIYFRHFVVDFQRVYKASGNDKDKEGGGIDGPNAIQRSQLAVIVSTFLIKDCTPNSRYPLVFDSSGATASFFDLCIRIRGPYDTDLVKVECFDLNVACISGKAESISIKTDERFLWKLLDVLNRILIATSALAGVDMQLDFDETNGEYTVSTKTDVAVDDDLMHGQDYETYELSRSEQLYDIAIVRVSPLKLVISFLREPDAARYGKMSGVIGARAINYLTTQMSFQLDRAQLNFAGYAARDVKGGSSEIISMLTTVYITRLKRKAFSLLTAVSLKDWNYLTSREDGEDGYVEGDLLRLTGNVAGRSAGLILKRVGQGFDQGVRAVTGTIGDEIQNATEFVGVGAVGAGVNSAVTGVGEAVGAAVKGTGHGAGQIVRGAVVGVGQAAGGVGGGAAKAVKQVGEGVVRGDAGHALAGIGEGASSAAYGLGQGVETAVMGAADGVKTVGHGLTDGVKSLMKGICYCCIDSGSEHGSNASEH